MDFRFSDYFIAASYNTYLVEDQLKGPSSVDGYISALKRSCRFIERTFCYVGPVDPVIPVDLWEPMDNDPQEPMVYHGGTLTSKLALSAALSTISELAFEHSRYVGGHPCLG